MSAELGLRGWWRHCAVQAILGSVRNSGFPSLRLAELLVTQACWHFPGKSGALCLFSFFASSQNFSLPGEEFLGGKQGFKNAILIKKLGQSPGVWRLCWVLYRLMSVNCVFPKLLVGGRCVRAALGSSRPDGGHRT